MESWAGPGNKAVKRWAFATVFRGGIKPGTEQNETGSNLCTLQTWLLDTGWKIGFKMPLINVLEADLVFCTCHEDRTSTCPEDRTSTQQTIWSHSSMWNILAVHLVSLSGVTSPCLQVRGQQCHYCLWAQPWGVELSVAHPLTGREWYRVQVYSLQIQNKHHQRVSTGMSTFGKLGLGHWDVLLVYL